MRAGEDGFGETSDVERPVGRQQVAADGAELLARGFVIKNKEHLANFRAFEAAFGPDGKALPNKVRLPIGQGCAGCCFEIGDATFCDVCGAFPAQRTAAVSYGAID